MDTLESLVNANPLYRSTFFVKVGPTDSLLQRDKKKLVGKRSRLYFTKKKFFFSINWLARN